MKQLLGVAPTCRSLLQSTLVTKRSKPAVNEVTLSPDPGTPTVDISIDGLLVSGVQLDGGSSVNLMNMETMLSLQLTGIKGTKLILRRVDQSRVKLVGILHEVKTIIAGLVYYIDFIVFQPSSPHTSYPILLGRLWLYQAKAIEDWGRGLIIIGKGKNKVKLSMYPH